MTIKEARDTLLRYSKRDYDYTSGCGCHECAEIAEAMECAIDVLSFEINRKTANNKPESEG